MNDISSSIPTISASVELFIFHFCFIKFYMAALCPMVTTIPVWLFMSWYTPNTVWMQHWSLFVFLIPSMSGSPMVDWMNLMTRFNFFWSPLYGYFTLVKRKAKYNCTSGMALLARYRSFTVTLWNVMASYWFILYRLFLLMLNRRSTADVSTYPVFISTGSLSSMSMIYSYYWTVHNDFPRPSLEYPWAGDQRQHTTLSLGFLNLNVVFVTSWWHHMEADKHRIFSLT